MNKTLLVEACEGRHVPLHPNDVPGVSGHTKLLPGDEPLVVLDSPAIRRRIRAGDLRVVTLAERVDAKLKPDTQPASASTSSEK